MCLQVSGEREFFAQMVVDAVTALDPGTLDLKMVGMKKVCVGAGRWTSTVPSTEHHVAVDCSASATEGA
jgi:hypothetical protein